MVTDLVIAARSAGVEREMEIEAAWYVLTILLRMGHPARMDEIVPKCRLFPASDEFLQFLCRMPNSPCSSQTVAFREFVVGGASQFVPRVTVRFAGPKKAWDFGDVYFRCSSRKRKKMHQSPDPKRKAPLRHSNGGSAEDGPTSYLLPIENIIQSPLTDKAHPAVPALMRRNNLSMDMIVTECSSGVVKEGMQWTPLLNCDVDLWHDSTRNCEKIDRIDVNYLEPSVSSKECDRVLDSEIKAYAAVSVAAVDDNFVAMTPCSMVQDEVNSRPSAVLRNRKEQNSEKVSNYGDIAEGLVVADSEDNRDQAQAEGAVGSSRDLLDIRMPPVVKLEAATTSLQCESSSSQKPEEIFLDRRLDTNPSVGLLNDAEIEDDKINKNKRAEALDSKQILKKLKRTQHNKLQKKGNRNGVSIVPKWNLLKFPNFESFVVEEEEGSVPHPRAHPYHIHNELKMLERFGGRCFIIKYEGFFKSGNSECFVLEHVEHDRPEGIVHRDVKPGNFLFSRKHNKGYLIDFNLALVRFVILSMFNQLRILGNCSSKISPYLSWLLLRI
ncbi:unnamed protein product [Spirodela intermedia]|uniref:Aminoglycoside phosphotransferase domain-containing protein n=1 Tax=Spirodela intermedia TaxID=51605 RepID=A0A7I8IGX8_SPIIN|nr:unnamed protein product [Spirodela intermedia]CAA6657130.1 unnamed protein product [Spirodela intermedia]